MAISFKDHAGDQRTVSISGTLMDYEYSELLDQLEMDITLNGSARLLIYLRNFEGFGNGEWNHGEFMGKYDPFIKGIAIVGDPKWKEETYLFTARGLRPVPIEYFTIMDEEKAKEWLSSQ